MKVGYARVSTDDQSLDLQVDALKAAGCEKIFIDKESGAKAERPGLNEALEFVRAGDVLAVWRLDRLGRSMSHLVKSLEGLHARKVGFESLQEKIETKSAGGKLVFHLFAALAEFERSLIQERTRAGIAAARARGRNGGRKPLDEDTIIALRQLAANPDNTPASICKTLQISRSTFYKYTPG